MSKTPYISVIIPTYNRSKFITAAIESVLQQNKNKWEMEVIVVDDGSTDDTEEILKHFKDKITYIKTFHSGKPATARNIGIKQAKGELIAFLDSDDMWVPDKLTQQISLFNDRKIVMTCGNAMAMDANGKLTEKPLMSDKQLKSVEHFSTLVQENNVSTLTTIIRKSAFEAAGGFDEATNLRAVEDYELWLRIAAKYPGGIKSVPNTLAYYRQHDDNISKADALVAVERLLNVYNCIWDFEDLHYGDREVLETKLDEMHENWSRLKKEVGDKPAISVVMSVYNGESYLKPAINSILKQTFKDFEFIIVDDGSSDSSVDIIRGFKDPRIRLIRQTNHKLVYSLNKGVRIARADFIARQDADDISLPSRFEKELAWISGATNRGLVGSFFTYIYEKSSTPSNITITSPTRHIDLYRMMYQVNPFAHGSTMYRKEAWQHTGGYRDNYGPTEDYDLWRRLAQNWEMGQLPEVLYWYRISPTSISHTNQSTQHKYAALIVKELWEQPIVTKSLYASLADAWHYVHMNSPFMSTIYQQYIDQQVYLAQQLLWRGHLRSGYTAALAAFTLKPRNTIKRLWKILVWAMPKRLLGRQLR